MNRLTGCLVLGLSALVPAASFSQTAPADAKSTSITMVERLRAVAERSSIARNIVLNKRRAELFRRLAERTSEVPKKFSYEMAYATELLQAGQTEKAILEIGLLLDKARKMGLAPPVVALRELQGLAYLRLAEQQNCLMDHRAASCLMPITAAGHHTLAEGARQAFEIYLDLAKGQPKNLEYRWLLNLAAMAIGKHPLGVPDGHLIPEKVFDSDYPLPRFADVAPQLGLATVGLSGGTVVDDLDGDGLLDVVVTSWGQLDQMRLFLQNEDGTFRERTRAAGLVGQIGGLNLVHADYDGDGDLDLFVLRGAWLDFFGQGDVPNSLLNNQGDGTFVDVTEESGLLEYAPSQTAAWADYDRDGDLDLFVGNESVGKHDHPSRLYENQGDGTFKDVAAELGVDVRGVVKGVAWGDYNNDGLQDLYVSRFAQENLLFRSVETVAVGKTERPIRFVNATAEAGVAAPKLSFATWFWDFDNDGFLDLFAAPFLGFNGRSLAATVKNYLTDSQAGETPRLYHNLGDGTFKDVTEEKGLDTPLLAMGASFGDLDNDGFLDLYLGTGEPYLGTLVPNRMYRNDRGRSFQDVTTAGGFGHLQKGHGISFVDIDNDGDQDVYAVMGGAYEGDVYPNVLFRNPGNTNSWVGLELRGDQNRFGHGARIQVICRTKDRIQPIYSTVGNGSSFGSTSMRQVIGLGRATSIERVVVLWPDGREESFGEVEPQSHYRLRKGTGKAVILRLADFPGEAGIEP